MKNPVCVVVGVGPGMGLALSRKFAKEGYSVAMIARNAASLNELSAQLNQEGLTCVGFAADIANERELKAAFDQISQQLGVPEILIYNASVLHEGMPTTLSIETMIEDFKVNVVGALISVQCVAPAMKQSKKGTILITGGGLALQPYAMMSSLSVGKAGIRNLTQSIAQELEPAGIHVAMVIIQGMIKAGTRFDPETIAEEYWQLHLESPGQFQREIFFQ